MDIMVTWTVFTLHIISRTSSVYVLYTYIMMSRRSLWHRLWYGYFDWIYTNPTTDHPKTYGSRLNFSVKHQNHPHCNFSSNEVLLKSCLYTVQYITSPFYNWKSNRRIGTTSSEISVNWIKRDINLSVNFIRYKTASLVTYILYQGIRNDITKNISINMTLKYSLKDVG